MQKLKTVEMIPPSSNYFSSRFSQFFISYLSWQEFDWRLFSIRERSFVFYLRLFSIGERYFSLLWQNVIWDYFQWKIFLYFVMTKKLFKLIKICDLSWQKFYLRLFSIRERSFCICHDKKIFKLISKFVKDIFVFVMTKIIFSTKTQQDLEWRQWFKAVPNGALGKNLFLNDRLFLSDCRISKYLHGFISAVTKCAKNKFL